MGTGAVGTNGAHAQKVVASVRKPKQEIATAHQQLTVVQIVLLIDRVARHLECVTIQVAQVR